MDTNAIRYRVADFLKQHPPFHFVEEADLLALAGHGVVRFYEANQYILSQGASRYQIYVIQQGTVSLWNEGGAEPRLLDVREAGDMLGIDQLQESRVYPYSAISRGDVLVYAFPTQEIWPLVEHYPGVADYIAAYGSLTTRRRQPRLDMDPHAVALRELIASRPPTCHSQASVRDVARQLLSSGQDAIAIVDPRERVCGIVTVALLAQWVANGDTDREEPIGSLIKDPPAILAPEASVVDGVLAMEVTKSNALVITSDGTLAGSLQGLLTSRNFRTIFGDRPGEILHEIRNAAHTRDLRDLNRRSRKLTLRYLNRPSSVDWLTRFTSAVDSSIVERVISMSDPESVEGCWCLCGTSGRREALPSLAPKALLIANDDRSADVFHRVLEGIGECGYLPAFNGDFEPRFYVATVEEWKDRYLGWLKDPILKKIYLAHAFFDLRPVAGSESFWNSLESTVVSAVNRDFLHLVANDCLSTLPPLTFFHNAVLDESGEETTVFRLEETALRPLVDVGRVFGLATGKVFRSSTFERFAVAQNSWPEYASIFREASEALRIVLWQQGRFGITQATSGADLPPAVLGPYDRQLMKSAFRAILRLIEFTGNLQWLTAL